MKRKFESDLSVNGINNLIKQLNYYKTNTLQHRLDMFVKALADEGVSIAQANVAKLDAIFTGELIASIRPQFVRSGNGTCIFYVMADSEHAVFVEFGTGYIGQSNPYPYPIPQNVSWNYISGRQVLANARKGVYGWFYKNDKGEWQFTEGMESRPFMYETYIELMDKVVPIAKAVFK